MDVNNQLAQLDVVFRVEGIISTIANADWLGARDRHGTKGIVVEVIETITYHNAPMIFVSLYSAWSGWEIVRLLSRHGVNAWDLGVTSHEFFFRVKLRQVKWAEYLLLRAGVPVVGMLVEPRNSDWVAGYPPGSEPPNWSQ